MHWILAPRRWSAPEIDSTLTVPHWGRFATPVVADDPQHFPASVRRYTTRHGLHTTLVSRVTNSGASAGTRIAIPSRAPMNASAPCGEADPF